MESPLPVEHVPRRDAPPEPAPVSALRALDRGGPRPAEDGHVLQPLHPLPAHGAFREPALLVRLPRMDLEAGEAALDREAADPLLAHAEVLGAPDLPLDQALQSPLRRDLVAGLGKTGGSGPRHPPPPGPGLPRFPRGARGRVKSGSR